MNEAAEEQALAFLRRAPQLASLGELSGEFEAVAQSMGFSHFGCVHFATPGEPVRPRVLFGHEHPEWTAHYIASNCARVDHGVQMVFSETRPFTWTDIKKRNLSREQTSIFAQAADHKLLGGLIVPIHGSRGEILAVSLVSEYGDADISPQERATLAALTTLYAIQGLRLTEIAEEEQARADWPLSPREVQCLSWAARGKTMWEIAQILGLAQTSVKTHMDNARRRLGAATIIQAVLEAWKRGLLVDVDD